MAHHPPALRSLDSLSLCPSGVALVGQAIYHRPQAQSQPGQLLLPALTFGQALRQEELQTPGESDKGQSDLSGDSKGPAVAK